MWITQSYLQIHHICQAVISKPSGGRLRKRSLTCDVLKIKQKRNCLTLCTAVVLFVFRMLATGGRRRQLGRWFCSGNQRRSDELCVPLCQFGNAMRGSRLRRRPEIVLRASENSWSSAGAVLCSLRVHLRPCVNTFRFAHRFPA